MTARKDEDFHWAEEGRTLLADCSIFTVFNAHRISPQGQRADRYLLQAPDWAMVIPLVKSAGNDACLMVRQYRQGSGSVTMEFPAGMVDPGETPEEAVIRELREETGYEAGKLSLLGAVNPNSAIMTNTQYVYLAENLVHRGGLSLDEHEDLEVEVVPLSDVIRQMGQGAFDNGTMMMALGFFLQRQYL
jgi:8-oxo-dGTP pyrophosphatase MutT (NUDIX family)